MVGSQDSGVSKEHSLLYKFVHKDGEWREGYSKRMDGNGDLGGDIKQFQRSKWQMHPVVIA